MSDRSETFSRDYFVSVVKKQNVNARDLREEGLPFFKKKLEPHGCTINYDDTNEWNIRFDILLPETLTIKGRPFNVVRIFLLTSIGCENYWMMSCVTKEGKYVNLSGNSYDSYYQNKIGNTMEETMEYLSSFLDVLKSDVQGGPP